jgi:hypothetical protein
MEKYCGLNAFPERLAQQTNNLLRKYWKYIETVITRIYQSLRGQADISDSQPLLFRLFHERFISPTPITVT